MGILTYYNRLDPLLPPEYSDSYPRVSLKCISPDRYKTINQISTQKRDVLNFVGLIYQQISQHSSPEELRLSGDIFTLWLHCWFR